MCVSLELMQLSGKQMDATIRELENWNFRLNLDEGALAATRLCAGKAA